MTNFGQNWLKVTIQNWTPEKRPKSLWNWRKIWPSRWKKSCSDRMFNKSVPKKRQKMTQNGPESQKRRRPLKNRLFCLLNLIVFCQDWSRDQFWPFFFYFSGRNFGKGFILTWILAKVLFSKNRKISQVPGFINFY